MICDPAQRQMPIEQWNLARGMWREISIEIDTPCEAGIQSK